MTIRDTEDPLEILVAYLKLAANEIAEPKSHIGN